MSFRNQEFVNKFLAVLAVVIIIAFTGLFASNSAFNQKEHTVRGMEDTSESYMELGNREDSTSSWMKRDFDLNGQKVDLQAQTYDGTLHNLTSDNIVSWTLTIRIKDDCFVNNAWCGIMEIHQHTGTEKETVQTLDLRNYKLEDINLDYLYDGDLLIPLKRGDYLVYTPSAKDGEVPIRAKEELTMGMIFYYLDKMDLTDYQIDYYYHRDLTQEPGFYIIIGLVLLWIALFLMKKLVEFSYRRAEKEMMLKQTGISYMSEIYDVIYIVDLLNMELIPAGSGEHRENEVLRGKGDIARFFKRLIEDVSDRYKDLVRTFVDLDTLPDRLDADSIVCEYISDSKGWCQARFFAMERSDDKKPGRAVFTIRVIHDEKLEMDRIEQQLSKEASDKAANIILYHNISPEINDKLRIVSDRASRIEAESQDELIKSYAADIAEGGRVLSIQVNKILGSLKLFAGLMKLDNVQYSFRNLIKEVIDYTSDEISKKGLNLETDISPRIPDGLYGDHNKLMTITSYLILNAVKFTEKGSIRFSVFGKEDGDKVHLLFSIKDTGKGFREEDVEEFAKQSFDPDHRTLNLMNRFGLGISLMDGMLVEMGSELKLVSACGEGSEFYYEIEQTVMDHTPIGKIEC